MVAPFAAAVLLEGILLHNRHGGKPWLQPGCRLAGTTAVGKINPKSSCPATIDHCGFIQPRRALLIKVIPPLISRLNNRKLISNNKNPSIARPVCVIEVSLTA